ncbi:MAG: extracellular solute-binding protein [Anaerolineaceae bacterium]|jgi:ABC-type glycerol-3-phosphate transport system substrate-binding protein
MSSHKKLPFTLLTIILISATVLSGCALLFPQEPVVEEPTPQPVEPVTLVVWADGAAIGHMETDPEGRGAYAVFLKEQFEAENPGVTVLLEDHGWDATLRHALVNALLAGTAPDVIVGEGFFRTYAALGALLPIDITNMEDNLIPGTYAGALFQDRVYGLSGYTAAIALERNCAVIERAGLDCDDPPTTWAELIEEARIITEAGNGEFFGYTMQGPGEYALGAAFRISVLMRQLGTGLSRPGPGGADFPNFNDPAHIPVYQFLRDIYPYTPPGLAFEPDEGAVYSQLFLGRSAYQIAGAWHVLWAREMGCEDCRYSPLPLPPDGVPASMVVANVIYGALATSDTPELAVEFVKFTQRDEVQALVHEATHRLPATRRGLEALRPEADPAVQSFIDILLTSEELGAMPQWEKNETIIWDAYTEFLTKLLTTDEDIQTLMDEVQARAEAALE